MNMDAETEETGAAGDGKARRRVAMRIARELWRLENAELSLEERKAGWETHGENRVRLARQLVRALEKRGFTILPPQTPEPAAEDG